MTATADSGIRVTIMITTVAVSDLVVQIPKEKRMTNSKAGAVFQIHLSRYKCVKARATQKFECVLGSQCPDGAEVAAPGGEP